jgi:hypothetical protein
MTSSDLRVSKKRTEIIIEEMDKCGDHYYKRSPIRLFAEVRYGDAVDSGTRGLVVLRRGAGRFGMVRQNWTIEKDFPGAVRLEDGRPATPGV